MTSAHRGTADRRVLVFILGMARSGTSALTRVLSLCGGTLPAGMMGGFVGNPRGYWEPRKVVNLNEEILRRHHSAGYDPSLRLEEESAFDAEEKAACIKKLTAYLTTLPTAPVVVIKDPLIAGSLSELWFEAARLASFDITAIIAVRNPQEVIASFQKLETPLQRHSWELGGALWLKYSLLAEKRTRSLPRVFVEYPNLIENWRREVKRVSEALAINLTTSDGEGAIEEYLEQDLRHERSSGPIKEIFGTEWISTVYELLSKAARDEPWDEAKLDRVFQDYCASERGFRTAFEDFQRARKVDRLIPASFSMMIKEVLAITHLRRGTWA